MVLVFSLVLASRIMPPPLLGVSMFLATGCYSDTGQHIEEEERFLDGNSFSTFFDEISRQQK